MSDKFLAWIIALGDEVKIIEPDSVVEQMRSNLAELQYLYGHPCFSKTIKNEKFL